MSLCWVRKRSLTYIEKYNLRRKWFFTLAPMSMCWVRKCSPTYVRKFNLRRKLFFTQDASVSKGKKRKRKPALVKSEGVGGGDGGSLANTSQVVGFCFRFFFVWKRKAWGWEYGGFRNGGFRVEHMLGPSQIPGRYFYFILFYFIFKK